MKTVHIGYIPLMDAAVPIVAAECGFAEREGLKIELVREVSWANIRDKLILGMFDAAHMLAPLAVATSLGLGHVKLPISVPFVLNSNGNCITISTALYRAITDLLGHPPANAKESAKAMAVLIEKRKRSGAEPLNFGVVFPFSVHAFLIRHWLRLGGVDTQTDVQFVVVPPPFTTQSLSNGLIDGYCVGDPWNSRAVEAGVGCIAAFGADICERGPDKILAMRGKWAGENEDTVMRLLRAMKAAAAWCAEEGNYQNLADLLSQAQFINVAPRTIMHGLTGKMAVSLTETRSNPNFINLGRFEINRPDPRQALWIYAELMHVLGTPVRADQAQLAEAVYRCDLFDAALGPPDSIPLDPVGLKNGPTFRSHDLKGYLTDLSFRPSMSAQKGS